MTIHEQAILNRVNANNWAALYRCRWSESDANLLVPQLTALLSSQSADVVNEALRALFRIGPPAASATPSVATLTYSTDPMTKQLAVLALGQIAHQIPAACVGPLTSVLNDECCRRDALRALAFIGTPAKPAIETVMRLYDNPDAKVRRDAIVTASAICRDHPEVLVMLHKASADRSKIVRDAAIKLLRDTEGG
jgi:HEAT repeat protein